MAQKAGTKSNAAILTILLFLAYLLSAFFKTAANVAVPEFQKAIGLSASAAGIISGMFFFPYAFLQLATGSLCEKYSVVRIVAIGLAFSVIGSLFWALADSTGWIIAGRFLQGLGFGPTYLGTLFFISSNFDDRTFSVLTGISIVSANLGCALSSTPLRAAIDNIGIRSTFIILAGIITAITVLLLTFKGQTRTIPCNTMPLLEEYGNIVRTSIHSVPTIVCLILWTINGGVLLSFQGLWGSEWTAAAFPIQIKSSGLAVLMISFGMMAGGIMGGPISNCQKNHGRSICLLSFLEIICLALLIACMKFQIGFTASLIMDFIYGMLHTILLVQITAYIRELSGPIQNSIIIGIFNFTASLMALLMQWFAGMLLDWFSKSLTTADSYSAAYSILGISLLAAACSSVLLIIKKRNV